MKEAWLVFVIPVILGLLVNEACDLAPWLARRVICRAAKYWSMGDSGRATVIEEEWASIIADCPGKTTKLALAMRFMIAAACKAEAARVRKTAKRLGYKLNKVQNVLNLLPSRRRVRSWDIAALHGACIERNEVAWNELVRRQAYVVGWVMRQYKLSRADSIRVSQRVWLKLIDNLGTVEPDYTSSWLVVATRRECDRYMLSTGRDVHAIHDEILCGLTQRQREIFLLETAESQSPADQTE